MSLLAVSLLSTLLTLGLSLALPFVIRPLLMRLGIMDVPNERSSHERPVLRGLGLAVLVAIFAGGAVAVVGSITGGAGSGDSLLWPTLLVVCVGSLAAGLLGLAEDLRGLSVPVRSVCLLLIAGSVAVALLLLLPVWLGGAADPVDGVRVQWVAGAAVSIPTWGLVLLAIYAVLFISSYINVANFMDGLNGISGFHGVVAGLTFAAAGWFTAHSWLVVAGLVLAAGFAGFLPWNLSKPGAFLGDVGSYLLGGSIAITSFAALVAGVPLLATIGPMVICFGDVGVTLVKRVRAGKRWDEPHKEHVYQRIQQAGYSHVAASGIAAGCTLITSILGLSALFTEWPGTLALLVAGLAVLALYLLLPRLLPRRRTPSR